MSRVRETEVWLVGVLSTLDYHPTWPHRGVGGGIRWRADPVRALDGAGSVAHNAVHHHCCSLQMRGE
jgi:hypothetical protein